MRRVRPITLGLCLQAAACAGANTASHPACLPGQSNLDGTCVSQSIADYVGCIRATGATVAADNSKSLAAAAGAAGVSASTQADVKDRLEKRYATQSDANSLEIIQHCYSKTGGAPSGKTAINAEPSAVPVKAVAAVIPARNFVRSKDVAVGATEFGPNLLTNGPPFEPRPNHVEYDVNLVGGKTYELWVEYTAAQSRPTEIRFNGEVVAASGIASVTGSWNERDCRWFKEATVVPRDGVNVLVVHRESYFPHIKSFKFVPAN